MIKITHSDRIILECLQNTAKPGLETLAVRTGLSITSVQRRLKVLKDAGVIVNEVAVVDPSAVGQKMKFIVMVELERERQDHIDAFARSVEKDPQVQQCYYVTGDADFCLVCIAQDMEDFEKLTKRLFFDDSNVRRFRTSVVMRSQKVGLSVPIRETETG